MPDIPLPLAGAGGGTTDGVTVTWLGITTLLFDDGETQILTDATFSRFPLADILLFRPLESDIAEINRALDEFRIDRLKAIVPVHSHFDHAIDAGHVANRTGAMVLGSESTSNIARGSAVPVDQYQTLQYGESRYFGKFTLTLFESRHVAQLPNGDHFFSGVIDSPLEQPARVNAWQSGIAYSLLVEHPAGTALVQGSAGYLEGQLAETRADVVLLSIAGLSGRGPDYARSYFRETVGATGALRVLPIHFDDFTRPFGDVGLFPDVIDDVVTSAAWLRDFGSRREPQVAVEMPPFGKPLVLY